MGHVGHALSQAPACRQRGINIRLGKELMRAAGILRPSNRTALLAKLSGGRRSADGTATPGSGLPSYFTDEESEAQRKFL